MTVDMGTGDGRAVLETAAGDPRVLAIGIDANAAAMAESSRRASRPAAKGGAPNALFLVCAAEAVPAELRGIADLVTVRFPWGSLLRGCLGGEPAVAAGLASLLHADGVLEVLLAPAERDRLHGLPTDTPAVATAIAETFEGHGLQVVEARPATSEEVRASRSTWARRLLSAGSVGRGASAERAVTLVRMRSSPR